MITLAPGLDVDDGEFEFRASRAGGPGGQNVNKVATRVELFWDVAQSPSLTERVRARLTKALSNRLDQRGRLRITSGQARTQRRNRELCLERLRELVTEALKPRKRRVATKPTRGAKERRLATKRVRSDVKRQRRSQPEG